MSIEETQEQTEQSDSKVAQGETPEETKARLEGEVAELERKKAGLEEDSKRLLGDVVKARKERRSLVSDEDINPKSPASPIGDPQAIEEVKELRQKVDAIEASTKLQIKSAESEALAEIYRRHPELSPENDTDNTQWSDVKYHLARLGVRRGTTKDALIADFEDAYLLANKDTVLKDRELAGRRQASVEQVDVGGTSTSMSTGEDKETLTMDEKALAHKMFPEMTHEKAEELYLNGKLRRQGKI